MSPVSPKPCSITTAGPWPPTRTCSVASPDAISISRSSGGNGTTAAPASSETNTIDITINKRPSIAATPVMNWRSTLYVGACIIAVMLKPTPNPFLTLDPRRAMPCGSAACRRNFVGCRNRESALVLVDRAGKLSLFSANAVELTETLISEGWSGAAPCLLNWTNIAVAEKTAIVFCWYRGWHAT